jgi:hypothetical protein
LKFFRGRIFLESSTSRQLPSTTWAMVFLLDVAPKIIEKVNAVPGNMNRHHPALWELHHPHIFLIGDSHKMYLVTSTIYSISGVIIYFDCRRDSPTTSGHGIYIMYINVFGQSRVKCFFLCNRRDGMVLSSRRGVINFTMMQC